MRVLILSVALSSYRVVVDEEQVMLGNEILLKCNIPSFVADFVVVDGWVDSEGLGIADDGNYQGNQSQQCSSTVNHTPVKCHKRAEQCIRLAACCALLSLQRSQCKMRKAQTMLIVLGFHKRSHLLICSSPFSVFQQQCEIASQWQTLPELFANAAFFLSVTVFRFALIP